MAKDTSNNRGTGQRPEGRSVKRAIEQSGDRHGQQAATTAIGKAIDQAGNGSRQARTAGDQNRGMG